MADVDMDGLIAWENPELQNHPLWWCDYEWDQETCPHPSVAGNGGKWTCDACGKDGC